MLKYTRILEAFELWAQHNKEKNLFIQDYSSSGHENSSDEEWETTSDVSTDQEQPTEHHLQALDRNIIDDIGRRSIAALSNNAPDSLRDSNETPITHEDVAEVDEQFEGIVPVDEDTSVSNSANNGSNDVRVRPVSIAAPSKYIP